MATTTYRGVTLLEINQAGQITLANAALENLSRGVSGHVSIDCAGSLDITLTDADENDEAKNAIVTCTGLLTGSINLIVPNEARKYVIYNNTTGAFTLTVKTVSGTGIAVAQTETALLYSDGTNIMNAVSAGSMSITESDITLSDVTTNDVTISAPVPLFRHGFLKLGILSRPGIEKLHHEKIVFVRCRLDLCRGRASRQTRCHRLSRHPKALQSSSRHRVGPRAIECLACIIGMLRRKPVLRIGDI